MLELLALSVFLNPEAPPYQVNPGQGYDGVVLLNIDGDRTVCTGALLTSGRHILTAASCFETQAPGTPSTTADSDRVTVTFHLPAIAPDPADPNPADPDPADPDPADPDTIVTSRQAAAVHIHPRWDNSPQRNHNLAIIELSNPAPAQADRYAIYRSSVPGIDEINRTFTRIGYGIAGNGVQGEVSGSIIQRKLMGGNRYDAFGDLLNTPPKGAEANPSTVNAIAPNTQLLYDFDGFSRSRDALGREYQLYDLGVLRRDTAFSELDDRLLEVRPPLPVGLELDDSDSSEPDPNTPNLPPAQLAQLQNPSLPIGLPWESGTTQGDEGSPAFIDGKIAGIASQRLRPQTEGIDITDELDGSVGEYFLDTRVSAYADFVDEILGKSP
ncbi:hypothetical protein [Spirulina major]|uniref:hypothetical protein n=1 Tax=Spirulina major TaxID=270636 RepID=UPI0009335AFC|nr:hypothetical protein [Spirulina major]